MGQIKFDITRLQELLDKVDRLEETGVDLTSYYTKKEVNIYLNDKVNQSQVAGTSDDVDWDDVTQVVSSYAIKQVLGEYNKASKVSKLVTSLNDLNASVDVYHARIAGSQTINFTTAIPTGGKVRLYVENISSGDIVVTIPYMCVTCERVTIPAGKLAMIEIEEAAGTAFATCVANMMVK